MVQVIRINSEQFKDDSSNFILQPMKIYSVNIDKTRFCMNLVSNVTRNVRQTHHETIYTNI